MKVSSFVVLVGCLTKANIFQLIHLRKDHLCRVGIKKQACDARMNPMQELQIHYCPIMTDSFSPFQIVLNPGVE